MFILFKISDARSKLGVTFRVSLPEYDRPFIHTWRRQKDRIFTTKALKSVFLMHKKSLGDAFPDPHLPPPECHVLFQCPKYLVLLRPNFFHCKLPLEDEKGKCCIYINNQSWVNEKFFALREMKKIIILLHLFFVFEKYF